MNCAMRAKSHDAAHDRCAGAPFGADVLDDRRRKLLVMPLLGLFHNDCHALSLTVERHMMPPNNVRGSVNCELRACAAPVQQKSFYCQPCLMVRSVEAISRNMPALRELHRVQFATDIIAGPH